MLNTFRMLIHPSSGASDLFVELFHGLYCSGSVCVGVTLWFGCGGVVSVCRLKPAYGYHTTTGWGTSASATSNQTNTTHEITQQISRKHLRMGVLTSETCWALNNEIKKASDIKLVSPYSTIVPCFDMLLRVLAFHVTAYITARQNKHMQFLKFKNWHGILNPAK